MKSLKSMVRGFLSKKYYWHLFGYRHEKGYGSIEMGLVKKNITQDTIAEVVEQVLKNPLVDDLVILNVSYLGRMSSKEFKGGYG